MPKGMTFSTTLHILEMKPRHSALYWFAMPAEAVGWAGGETHGVFRQLGFCEDAFRLLRLRTFRTPKTRRKNPLDKLLLLRVERGHFVVERPDSGVRGKRRRKRNRDLLHILIAVPDDIVTFAPTGNCGTGSIFSLAAK